ncbi:hypothetical protein BJ165DRAFT_1527863 [Panaeolus papilionaceus]|nr:hypothetical protein BJ165DRAFT_1527863 [Panaeolus papilionaceus]
MKLLLSTALIAASLVLAKERPRDPVAHERYASGEVMDQIMAEKEAVWSQAGQRGIFNPTKFTSSNGFNRILFGMCRTVGI